MQEPEGLPLDSADVDPISEALAGYFRFPSAELVAAAVSMWDTPTLVNTRAAKAIRPGEADAALQVQARERRWQREGVWYEPDRYPGLFEYLRRREGPFPRLWIAPGCVRIARTNTEAAERAKSRAAEAARAEIDALVVALNRPMALAGPALLPEKTAGRIVSAWSPKSRNMMVRKIASLDLAAMIGDGIPCMVTLTLPGDWLAVAPDAATAARKFDNWRRRYEKKWHVPLACIWKREFQRRGAPHWHLWLVPPTKDLQGFREWLSASWTDSLSITDPEERRKSLLAGTGVDFAEGMRARDPKRLAVYFLKESLGGEGKAYQNGAPAEWAGQSVGRFWGVRGIADASVSVPVDPRDATKIERAMRRVRESHGVTHERTVQRVDARTGTVRYRRVRRRAKVRGRVGWVTSNDGAAFGAALGRYATLLAEERERQGRTPSAGIPPIAEPKA